MEQAGGSLPPLLKDIKKPSRPHLNDLGKLAKLMGLPSIFCRAADGPGSARCATGAYLVPAAHGADPSKRA